MAGVRRTWDKVHYEKKAVERLERGEDYDDPKNIRKERREAPKEEFQAATRDAQGPLGSERAFIKARNERIDIDSKVGKTEIIDPTNLDRGGGYWCEVCACLLKDSASYLDHINGKKRK